VRPPRSGPSRSPAWYGLGVVNGSNSGWGGFQRLPVGAIKMLTKRSRMVIIYVED
jgi:hypothetical protein